MILKMRMVGLEYSRDETVILLRGAGNELAVPIKGFYLKEGKINIADLPPFEVEVRLPDWITTWEPVESVTQTWDDTEWE